MHLSKQSARNIKKSPSPYLARCCGLFCCFFD
nr:MAG TPA_asm: endoprotease [Caudoviricetes sp.]